MHACDDNSGILKNLSVNMSSPIREVEVNVVSSPESSRNATPEPENFRLINQLATSNITCFPVIKSGEIEKADDKTNQKSSSGSTNFSISSILSRTEPALKKNGFFPGIDRSLAADADNNMLSRYVFISKNRNILLNNRNSYRNQTGVHFNSIHEVLSK